MRTPEDEVTPEGRFDALSVVLWKDVIRVVEGGNRLIAKYGPNFQSLHGSSPLFFNLGWPCDFPSLIGCCSSDPVSS